MSAQSFGSIVRKSSRHATLVVFLLLLVRPVLGQPGPPARLVERSGDRSVLLHWDAIQSSELKGYRVYRSTVRSGPYAQPLPTVFLYNHFIDFKVDNDSSYYYYATSVTNDGVESGASDTLATNPRVLSDDEFARLVEQTAFDFFWYEANPNNGLVRDRSFGSAASIAAVGFALSAYTVGIDNGWITRDEGKQRVLNTLEFFWGSEQSTSTDATGYKGFYYHFLDMQTGKRRGTTELSTIDTALLLGGVLHVGQYFSESDPDELRIAALSDSIYERVDWPWAQVRGSAISHGWRPESGFIQYDWKGYNEAMIVYLLALGSPTHPVEPAAWSTWTSTYKWRTHYGLSFIEFPPLFGHQYTHVWYDFRGIGDGYMQARGIDYFENSRRATLASRAYAVANPGGYAFYGEDGWGFTASDVPTGYKARGAPPAQNDDGTISPTAPGGSYPFTPAESIAALRNFYDTYRTQVWWWYGLRDAFNPTQNWWGGDFLGIDEGPIVLMIENYFTGSVWESFMSHPAAQLGLSRAGFVGALDVEAADATEALRIESIFPNPARSTTTVSISVRSPQVVYTTLYDLLGRSVSASMPAHVASGDANVVLDIASLSPGVYFVAVSTRDVTVRHSLIVVR